MRYRKGIAKRLSVDETKVGPARPYAPHALASSPLRHPMAPDTHLLTRCCSPARSATRRRKAEKADDSNLSRAHSARAIARLMTFGREMLTKSETITVAAIEVGVPQLVEAREIIAAFQGMIRKMSMAELEPWLERARSSLVAPFANGVIKNQAAISAAITSPRSNGQTEGQITKLKLVKRQMY